MGLLGAGELEGQWNFSCLWWGSRGDGKVGSWGEQQERSWGDTAERRGVSDGVRCLFGQGDGGDRDSTSSPRYLQMGKLRHKPGSAAALQKGCPCPQHPTGHTEGVKVISPPTSLACRRDRGTSCPAGGCKAMPYCPVLAQQAPCHPPIPARDPGIPHPVPARDPGIPHPIPARDRASLTSSPQWTRLSPRGPRSPAGGRGGRGPEAGAGAPLAPLRSLRSRRAAAARTAAGTRLPEPPVAMATGMEPLLRKSSGGGGGGEWTPPIPASAPTPRFRTAASPRTTPRPQTPAQGTPRGRPTAGTAARDTARGGWVPRQSDGGVGSRAPLGPERTRFPRDMRRGGSLGTPPVFLVLLPRGSLSLLHGTGQSHALPPLLPRPLCHPCGCRGVLGLRHSFCRNKHPKTPSERQPVPPPCQMCQLGTGWQENQEQSFPPGRAGDGGEGAAHPKASWRGAGQLPLTAICPSASSQAPGLMLGVTRLVTGWDSRGQRGLEAVGRQAGCGWG